MMLSYSIISSVILAFGYLAYRFLMSGQSQHTLNRNTLLIIYWTAILAPMVVLTFMIDGADFNVGDSTVEIGELTGGVLAKGGDFSGISYIHMISNFLYIYIIGAVLTATYFLLGLGTLWKIIRRGETTEFSTFNLILVDDSCKTAPFSWGRSIVMTRMDYDELGDMILLHEHSHLRFYHWLDLLLAYATICLQWYNPAAWGMREELKAVHEYQADEMVMKTGVDRKEYQMLLLKKAAGYGYQSLANSLNHSKLKKRVTMMYKKKTSLKRRMFALALIPAFGAGIAVTAIPSVARVLKSFAETPVSMPSETFEALPDGPSKERDVFVAVETQADFPGGMTKLMQWLSDNVVYPKEAEKAGIQGRVIIRFIIEADGTVTDPQIVKGVARELDKEAIRVVRSMPKWTPAQNGGKDVASYFTMPINFKLQNDEKTEAKND